MKFTRKGYGELRRGDDLISRHTVPEEAYERAAAEGEGTYSYRPPSIEIVVPKAAAAPAPSPAPAPAPSPAPNPAPAPAPGDVDQSLLQPGPLTSLTDGTAPAYCRTLGYPEQRIWAGDAPRSAQPQAATSGEPLVKQIRDGQVIAEYRALGLAGGRTPPNVADNPAAAASFGALRRTPYRNWRDGDTFELAPAVYEGEQHHAWLGQMHNNDPEYGQPLPPPKNITIRGATVNGKRPILRLGAGQKASNNTLGQSLIYLDQCENVTIENLDICGGNGDYVGKAGIYIHGAKNPTLRNLRVYGFQRYQANGIFGTDANSGTLLLDNVEMFDNGGAAGPEHNIYVNASASDPAFTVRMINSWSHSVYYGHLFKSRAQRTIIEGCYLMGCRAGDRQTEAFLVNITDGGILVMRNNLLVKTMSGNESNGASVTWANESLGDRQHGVTIENNTFVAFSKFYDEQQHQAYPMLLRYPPMLPGDPAFPTGDVSIRDNAFVGYCPYAGGWPMGDFRGANFVELSHDDLNADFTLRRRAMGSTDVIGRVAYSHDGTPRVRRRATVGAFD